MAGEVEVQVALFFMGAHDDAPVLDGKGEVQEVGGLEWLLNDLFESAIVIQVPLEIGPVGTLHGARAVEATPDAAQSSIQWTSPLVPILMRRWPYLGRRKSLSWTPE